MSTALRANRLDYLIALPLLTSRGRHNVLLLTAQIDPIAGSSGWAGAGLLGLVLAWLLFVHLPAKDKQLKDLLESKDGQLKEAMEANDAHVQSLMSLKDAHSAEMTRRHDLRVEQITAVYRAESLENRKEFKAALDAVLEHCEKEIDYLRNPNNHKKET